jgi:hypothetical protein
MCFDKIWQVKRDGSQSGHGLYVDRVSEDAEPKSKLMRQCLDTVLNLVAPWDGMGWDPGLGRVYVCSTLCFKKGLGPWTSPAALISSKYTPYWTVELLFCCNLQALVESLPCCRSVPNKASYIRTATDWPSCSAFVTFPHPSSLVPRPSLLTSHLSPLTSHPSTSPVSLLPSPLSPLPSRLSSLFNPISIRDVRHRDPWSQSTWGSHGQRNHNIASRESIPSVILLIISLVPRLHNLRLNSE